MSINTSFTEFLESFDTNEILALARLDIEQSRIDQGFFKIKHLLKTDAADPEVLTMAGKLYAQLGLFDNAINCFKQYLELKPEDVLEKFQYGMVHFDNGDDDNALIIWDELLSANPTHPPALFYKGMVLAKQNKLADAKQTLSILLQSAPADNLYFERAKELLQAMDRGESVITDQNRNNSGNGENVLPGNAYKTVN